MIQEEMRGKDVEFLSLLPKLRRMMMLTMMRRILVKKAVMAVVAVMVVMMMGLKLVLNVMMLPRRLTSPAKCSNFYF
jgi:type VI protein secretion system component VasF